MAIPPPKIDDRTYEQLVADTERLAQQFSQWKPPADGSTDAGRALIRIFGRMAALVTERLNRVPEKHFLAFLNLIGAQQQPPRAARVPLTVYLVDDSPVDAFLPAHTQVAALPQADEAEEVLFETEQDLVVVRSQLKSVIVHADKDYCDHLTAMPTHAESFPIFTIDTTNTFYIAADQLTTQVDSKEIRVTLPSQVDHEHWQWSYWQGESWQPLTEVKTERNQIVLQAAALPSIDWKPPQIKTIEGIEAQWLRVKVPRLTLELDTNKVDPITSALDEIKFVRTTIDNISPDQVFFNNEKIDISKDFLPFGETPQRNDTFYLASRNCLGVAETTVTLKIIVKSHGTPKDVSIIWESWTGQDWTPILNPDKVNGFENKEHTDLPLTVKLPKQVASTEVNGEENFWLRARLNGGNYGCEPRYETTATINDKTVTSKVGLESGTGFSPPCLQSLQLSCDAVNIPPKKLLKALPTDAFVHKEIDTHSLPDANLSDTNPALYLRFDCPFPNKSIALYLQIASPLAGALRDQKPVEKAAQLTWEYSTTEGWQPLSVIDGTKDLKQRGMVQFIGPTDLSSQLYFGQSGYWLRLRANADDFQIEPRLEQVLTNTVWASQSMTYQNEILGGGTGDAFLSLQTLHTPVLPGQQLVIQEPEMPSATEQTLIRQREGQDAITVMTDEAGQPEEIWVRWQEVSDFYGSGSHDRHYTLDRMTGDVSFGGEGLGMPPPQGRNNIRMARYQSGGGESGNREVETLTELKTTVPYIDRVTNHEPARGGAEVESIEAVKESGPKRLRHRDRAVTCQDIEDLTYAASSKVARVKVIPPKFDPVGLQWLPLYHLHISKSGNLEVKVEVRDSVASQQIVITIYGPGQSAPFDSKVLTLKQGDNSVLSEYEIKPEELKWGDLWRVELAQMGKATQETSKTVTGKIIITTPQEKIQAEFELPPQLSNDSNTISTPSKNIRNNPFTDFSDVGAITVLIVPQREALQPTPSWALVEQVKHYLSDRIAPTVQLQVTDPPWIQVTIKACIVPKSLAATDGLTTAVEAALTHFLHPLTGGVAKRGWPFGRRAYESDIYALLERMPGVSYVKELTITHNPSLGVNDFTALPEAERDFFLIYSGRHRITLAAPS